MSITVYLTLQDRHEAVLNARRRRMDAFTALQAALEAGDHAAALAANEGLARAADACHRILTEQWRLEVQP